MPTWYMTLKLSIDATTYRDGAHAEQSSLLLLIAAIHDLKAGVRTHGGEIEIRLVTGPQEGGDDDEH